MTDLKYPARFALALSAAFAIAFSAAGSADAKVSRVAINHAAAVFPAEDGSFSYETENNGSGAEDSSAAEYDLPEEEVTGAANEAEEETVSGAANGAAAETANGAAAGTASCLAGNAESGEAAESEAAATPSDAEADYETELRESLVDYAMAFVGGRYVYGGTDPHSGVDCSGFARYVMANAAGVALPRTSREQATVGTTVSAENMQPGDLIFYGNGRRVNHVAIYIGDGLVVHASNERNGIKVSQWNYRSPVRIASMLG